MENTFQRDLKIGQEVEKEVLKMVQKKYPDAYIIEGYCKEGDIHIPEPHDKYVEVKADFMSKKTGNIVVEVEFNGVPSALSTTKSYRWVFFTGDKYIITSPKRLKKMIEDNKLIPATFVGRGDSCSKQAYLVKQHLIENTAIKVIDL
jgi:hypothetical protein